MTLDPALRITFLKEEIKKYDIAYYLNSESLISDYDYDQLFSELLELENLHPHLLTQDSPTQRVSGSTRSEFNTIKHRIQMLSLSNSYNKDAILDFDKKVSKELEGEEYEYYAEMKFDGVSISILYVNGYLHKAVTRGNGIEGDDVTANIKTIRSIPLKVNDVYREGVLLTDFEVRGEVYITDEDFILINERQAEQELKLYANSRNLAAGTIKLLNPLEVAKRHLRMTCYSLFSQQIKLTSQSNNISLLNELGFPVSGVSELCSDINKV